MAVWTQLQSGLHPTSQTGFESDWINNFADDPEGTKFYYIKEGNNATYELDVYEYDILNNTLTFIGSELDFTPAGFPERNIVGQAMQVFKGDCYICFDKLNFNDNFVGAEVWRYNGTPGSWTRVLNRTALQTDVPSGNFMRPGGMWQDGEEMVIITSGTEGVRYTNNGSGWFAGSGTSLSLIGAGRGPYTAARGNTGIWTIKNSRFRGWNKTTKNWDLYGFSTGRSRPGADYQFEWSKSAPLSATTGTWFYNSEPIFGGGQSGSHSLCSGLINCSFIPSNAVGMSFWGRRSSNEIHLWDTLNDNDFLPTADFDWTGLPEIAGQTIWRFSHVAEMAGTYWLVMAMIDNATSSIITNEIWRRDPDPGELILQKLDAGVLTELNVYDLGDASITELLLKTRFAFPHTTIGVGDVILVGGSMDEPVGLTGQVVQILKSTDDGDTWSALENGWSPDLCSALQSKLVTGGTRLYAVRVTPGAMDLL